MGYNWIQGVTGDCKKLHEVKGGYPGLKRGTWGYKGLHGVTRGYIRLKLVTGG